MTFGNDFDKPVYFSLNSDTEHKLKLTNELNTFYAATNTTSKEQHIVNFDKDLAIDAYVAALSEDNWYRVRVKSVDTSNRSIRVYFVDFGYEDVIGANEFDKRVRKLNENFLTTSQLAFGTILIDEQGLKIGQLDTATLDQVCETFFKPENNDEYGIYELSSIRKIG